MSTYYDFAPGPVQEIAKPFMNAIDYFFPTFRLGQLKSLRRLNSNRNGKGKVITRRYIVDKTMNKGENTIFIIPPGLACGKSTLPPVTSSQFDICKDGGLLKKILKEGKKWDNSKDPDDVIVKYEARLYDGTLVAKSDKVEFTVVEDGHCCLTLPKTVKNMKKGEKVILTVRPQYGLGEKGLVPPNAIIVSTMYYQVERVSFLKDMRSWEMNTEEKIKVARKKKIVGNKLKFDKKFARASEKYEKALKFIEDDTSFSDHEKKVVRDLKYECYMSNSWCKHMLKDKEESVKLRAKAQEFKVKKVMKRRHGCGCRRSKKRILMPSTTEINWITATTISLLAGILKDGEERETPKDPDIVLDKIIEGLDRAVMTMKKGEVALLTIPYRYAFGSLDTPQEMAVVPPYSTLYNQ